MKRLAFLALFFAGACWGTGFPLGKFALKETDAPHLVLLRFAVAALVALPFALRSRQARALFRSPPVLAAGAFYGIAFVVQFQALEQTSVSLSALLVGAMPAMIAVASRLLGEKVTPASWAGVAAATAGAALLAGRPDGAGTPFGIALAIGSLFIFLGWAFALKYAPPAPPGEPLAIPAVSLVVAAITILPIALATHGAPKLNLSPAAWAGIVGQGVFPTFLATVAWQFGSARVGSAAAGVFINVEPLIGSLLGVWLYGDRATASLILGGAMIIAGSCLVVLGEKGSSGLETATEGGLRP